MQADKVIHSTDSPFYISYGSEAENKSPTAVEHLIKKIEPSGFLDRGVSLLSEDLFSIERLSNEIMLYHDLYNIGQSFSFGKAGYSLSRDLISTPLSDYEKELASVLRELDQYRFLEEGWDGYEGCPPFEGAVTGAIAFTNMLYSHGLALPQPMMASSGEVGLFFDNDSIFLDVGFISSTEYSYYAENNDTGDCYSDDDVSIDDPIPDELISIIKRVTGCLSTTD